MGDILNKRAQALNLIAARLVIILAAAITGFYCTPLMAKQPPELINLINVYERQKRALQVTAINTHIDKLKRLETTLTKADYKEDAALVRTVIDGQQRKLDQLVRTATKAPLPISNAPKGKGSTVYLKAPQAKLRGGLQGAFRQIRNWNTPECCANWSITGIIPGRYHIQISYIPVIGGGGEIQVRELDQLVKVNIPGASREKRFKRTVRVGTFKLRQSINLEIKPRTSNSRGVFLLSEVQLIPAG